MERRLVRRFRPFTAFQNVRAVAQYRLRWVRLKPDTTPRGFLMKTVSVVALAMLAAAAVIAQSGMRPGQWEITSQMQMPNMPAGFQMPSSKMTQCITGEQAKDPVSAVPRQGRGRGGKDDCKFSDYKTTGNTTTFTMACTSPDKMTGTGEMTFAGDDSYTSTMKMVMAQGEMTMKTTGKRIGDCTEDNPGRGRGLLK